MYGGNNDPFSGMFRQMHRQVQEMDRMMENMMDPFGMMDPFSMMRRQALPQGSAMPHANHQQVTPFGFGGMGGFGGMAGMGGMGGMGGFGGIFNAMNMMQQQALSDPNCHVFSHQSTMTFDGNGRPKVVERTLKTNGDTREERRRYIDNDKVETAVHQSIGDRTHIVEKKRDKDGKVRRQQKFINLDESNVDDFEREFSQRSQGRGTQRVRSNGPAICSAEEEFSVAPRSSRFGQNGYAAGPRENAPIITLPEEDETPSERYSNDRNGPVIREISEEEAESSIPKRRRGLNGYASEN